MKKLTVLVVIMLVAGLLAGCWVTPTSKLENIEVYPEEVTLTINTTALTGKLTEQLKVTAFYEDGTFADVTLNCKYSSDSPEVITVNAEGLVGIVKVGEIEEATILVTYTQHNFWTGRIIRTGSEIES